jgi:hypothetical protein
MDPIAAIITAVVTGATVALKETASAAIRDGYNGLKTLLTRKYPSIDVNIVESKPESIQRQAVLREELSSAAVEHDVEVVQLAYELLRAVARDEPSLARVEGIRMEDIEASAFRVKDVQSTGTAVSVSRARFSGDIDISTIRAGRRDPIPK